MLGVNVSRYMKPRPDSADSQTSCRADRRQRPFRSCVASKAVRSNLPSKKRSSSSSSISGSKKKSRCHLSSSSWCEPLHQHDVGVDLQQRGIDEPICAAAADECHSDGTRRLGRRRHHPRPPPSPRPDLPPLRPRSPLPLPLRHPPAHRHRLPLLLPSGEGGGEWI